MAFDEFEDGGGARGCAPSRPVSADGPHLLPFQQEEDSSGRLGGRRKRTPEARFGAKGREADGRAQGSRQVILKDEGSDRASPSARLGVGAGRPHKGRMGDSAGWIGAEHGGRKESGRHCDNKGPGQEGRGAHKDADREGRRQAGRGNDRGAGGGPGRMAKSEPAEVDLRRADGHAAADDADTLRYEWALRDEKRAAKAALKQQQAAGKRSRLEIFGVSGPERHNAKPSPRDRGPEPASKKRKLGSGGTKADAVEGRDGADVRSKEKLGSRGTKTDAVEGRDGADVRSKEKLGSRGTKTDAVEGRDGADVRSKEKLGSRGTKTDAVEGRDGADVRSKEKLGSRGTKTDAVKGRDGADVRSKEKLGLIKMEAERAVSGDVVKDHALNVARVLAAVPAAPTVRRVVMDDARKVDTDKDGDQDMDDSRDEDSSAHGDLEGRMDEDGTVDMDTHMKEDSEVARVVAAEGDRVTESNGDRSGGASGAQLGTTDMEEDLDHGGGPEHKKIDNGSAEDVVGQMEGQRENARHDKQDGTKEQSGQSDTVAGHVPESIDRVDGDGDGGHNDEQVRNQEGDGDEEGLSILRDLYAEGEYILPKVDSPSSSKPQTLRDPPKRPLEQSAATTNAAGALTDPGPPLPRDRAPQHDRQAAGEEAAEDVPKSTAGLPDKRTGDADLQGSLRSFGRGSEEAGGPRDTRKHADARGFRGGEASGDAEGQRRVHGSRSADSSGGAPGCRGGNKHRGGEDSRDPEGLRPAGRSRAAGEGRATTGREGAEVPGGREGGQQAEGSRGAEARRVAEGRRAGEPRGGTDHFEGDDGRRGGDRGRGVRRGQRVTGESSASGSRSAEGHTAAEGGRAGERGRGADRRAAAGQQAAAGQGGARTGGGEDRGSHGSVDRHSRPTQPHSAQRTAGDGGGAAAGSTRAHSDTSARPPRDMTRGSRPRGEAPLEPMGLAGGGQHMDAPLEPMGTGQGALEPMGTGKLEPMGTSGRALEPMRPPGVWDWERHETDRGRVDGRATHATMRDRDRERNPTGNRERDEDRDRNRTRDRDRDRDLHRDRDRHRGRARDSHRDTDREGQTRANTHTDMGQGEGPADQSPELKVFERPPDPDPDAEDVARAHSVRSALGYAPGPAMAGDDGSRPLAPWSLVSPAAAATPYPLQQPPGYLHYALAPVPPPAPPVAALPDGWESRFDPALQRWYFTDHRRRSTTWASPWDVELQETLKAGATDPALAAALRACRNGTGAAVEALASATRRHFAQSADGPCARFLRLDAQDAHAVVRLVVNLRQYYLGHPDPVRRQDLRVTPGIQVVRAAEPRITQLALRVDMVPFSEGARQQFAKLKATQCLPGGDVLHVARDTNRDWAAGRLWARLREEGGATLCTVGEAELLEKLLRIVAMASARRNLEGGAGALQFAVYKRMQTQPPIFEFAVLA